MKVLRLFCAITALCWRAYAAPTDSVVVFNEVMYHPMPDDPALEWVELHNQMAVDVDLSAWSLTGAARYPFPEGTIIPGGGFLLIAAAPDKIAAISGRTNVLGPFTGKLSNGGEALELRNNNDRLMDLLDYGTDGEWPAGADGSGGSLAKKNEELSTGSAEHWTVSPDVGGTPGAPNSSRALPTLAWNEAASGTATNFWLELANYGSEPVNLEGYVAARLSKTVKEYTFGKQILAANSVLLLARTNLDFAADPGDLMALYAPGKKILVDAFKVKKSAQARFPMGTGEWLAPARETPGAANEFAFHDEVVINEIMYHHSSFPAEGTNAFRESPEAWVELFNRSSHDVNLTGWRLDGGIRYTFPSGQLLKASNYLVVAKDPVALRAAYPGIEILGPFTNTLSRSHDVIVLKDTLSNPANRVAYFGGVPWPDEAHGGGSSLELRDPRSDNSRPEAWAASDETAKSSWQTYTYRAIAKAGMPGEPTTWREFALGMLAGAGEALLDDISVREATNTVQFVQNGDFQTGTKIHWRFVGNHQRSEVIPEPGNPTNYVLHLVASGPTEYQGNQIETTFATGRTIANGREYEISFRAKWLGGTRQLNTRLYFDRAPRTTTLAAPVLNGTPGRQNSRYATNAGPTFSHLLHSPAVPKTTEPVQVSLNLSDPDGVAGATLFYSVTGGPWQSMAMALETNRSWKAELPPRGPSTVIQFYVEARDSVGAISWCPAGGPASRALYKVDDALATTQAVHNVRVIMTPADANYLHLPVNVLSNERLPCTIIYKEREIFYDAGVRLKGSYVGRNVPRVGFNLSFPADHLFRGVHERVAVDRSQHADIGQGEILVKHMANHAGKIPSMYDDLIQFISPKIGYTSRGQLRMAAYDDIYLDSQFPTGSDGTIYEFEVIRIPDSTVDGNLESLKNPGGGGYVNLDIANYGDDKESYRWVFLISNNRERDDYAPIIRLGKAFSTPTATLDAAAQQAIDVDEWLRTFAFESLVGCADAYYTGGNHHNLRLYARPGDQRVLAMPWDWDSAFMNGSAANLIGGANFSKIVNLPANRRRYFQHLQDMVSTTFNSVYMKPWTTHYGALANQNFSSLLTYITQRATYASNQIRITSGPVPLTLITTNGTLVETSALTLVGTAALHIKELHLNGSTNPLAVTWGSATRWQANIPVALGSNTLSITALDLQGNILTNAVLDVIGTMPGGEDTDGDLMPDAWEIARGLNPKLADANLDPDQDGLTNYQEYLAGTDPHDRASTLGLTARITANGIQLRFKSMAGRSYTIQSKENSQTAWTRVQDFGADIEDHEILLDQPLAGRIRLFRLLTPHQ